MRYLFLFFSLFVSTVLAQEERKSLEVIAHVSNIFTHAPIVGATVVIMKADSTAIDTLTSSKFKYNGRLGGFSFEIPEPGTYIVHCSHPDYEDSYTPLVIKKFYKHERFRTGDMYYMQRKQPKALPENGESASEILDPAVVKATKVKFYIDKDTIVYNADAFNLSEGSMLDALIRQLPGVELKQGGQIYVNGRQVNELLLNGKDFFNRDRQLILDNLPSFMVQKVKVYQRATEWQRTIGDTLGMKSLVMDIGLKRKYSIGWIANADAGGGTGERFLGRLFALRLTPNSRISLYANANNVSDDRKPGENTDWKPAQMGTGVTTMRTAGLDYNVEDARGRYRVGGGASFSHNDAATEMRQAGENFLPDGNTYGRSTAGWRSHDVRFSTNHLLDLFKTSYWSFTLRPDFSFHDYSNRSNSAAAELSADVSGRWGKEWMDSIAAPHAGGLLRRYALNRTLRSALGDGRDWNTYVSLSKFFTIPHDNRFVFYVNASFRYDYAKNKAFDHYRLEYFRAEAGGQSTDFRNRYDERLDKGYEYSVTPTAVIHLNNYNRLYVDYAYRQRRRTTNRSLYLLNLLDGWGEDTEYGLGQLPSVGEMLQALDGGNSPRATKMDFVHTPSVKYERETYSDDGTTLYFSATLPLRVERNRLDYQRGALDTLFHRNVVFLEPQLSFSYGKYPSFALSANYQYTSSAPEMTYLVDLRDDSNPLNIMLGNPDLENRHSHHFDILFNRALSGQRMYNVGGSFNVHQNSLALGYTYDRTTGVRTVTPQTVDGNWDARVHGGFSLPLDSATRWNLQGNARLAYWNSVDLIDEQRSEVGSYYADATLKLDYRPTSRLYFGLKGDLHYQHSLSSREDFQTIDLCDFDYGLTAQVELPLGFKVSTDLTMYSRRGYSDSGMNTDEFVWNARLSKTFLKGNLALILDGFDLLGNLSNVRRSINAQGRTETWYNVTPRYALFHVVYRFNKQPKE